MRRWRRVGRVGPALGLALASAWIPVAAGGTSNAAGGGLHLYGLNGGAAALGVSFDMKNFLALSPILVAGAPRVSLGIDPTPTSGVRASPVDPGVIGAADAAGPAIIGLPPGFIPPYPLYADAAYPTGPEAAAVGNSHDIPSTGIPVARVFYGRGQAALDQAEGKAVVSGASLADPRAFQAAALPAGGYRQMASALASVLTAAGLSPRAEEPSATLAEVDVGEADGKGARQDLDLSGTMHSSAAGVRLLGGLLRISDLFGAVSLDWPSPSAPPAVRPTWSVGEATLMNVAVRFGPNGIEIADTSVPASVSDQINKVIGQYGLRFQAGEERRSDRAVSVSALSVAFDRATPAVPGLIGSEHPVVGFTLGSATLTFDSSLVTFPAGDDSSGGGYPPGAAVGSGDSAADAGASSGSGSSPIADSGVDEGAGDASFGTGFPTGASSGFDRSGAAGSATGGRAGTAPSQRQPGGRVAAAQRAGAVRPVALGGEGSFSRVGLLAVAGAALSLGLVLAARFRMMV